MAALNQAGKSEVVERIDFIQRQFLMFIQLYMYDKIFTVKLITKTLTTFSTYRAWQGLRHLASNNQCST